VVGRAAIVRFHWIVEQEMAADGKKVPTNLHILMNWQKQNDDWKLLSRCRDEVVISLCHSGTRRKARARNPFIHDL
jgi:hypothetical protein